jgi:hypothetical protein
MVRPEADKTRANQRSDTGDLYIKKDWRANSPGKERACHGADGDHCPETSSLPTRKMTPPVMRQLRVGVKMPKLQRPMPARLRWAFNGASGNPPRTGGHADYYTSGTVRFFRSMALPVSPCRNAVSTGSRVPRTHSDPSRSLQYPSQGPPNCPAPTFPPHAARCRRARPHWTR